MMGFIEPEQAEQAPAAISMEQEPAVAAEGEAAPREEEVMPEGTAEAETGGTSGVTSMEWMFMGASSFNQPIGDWQVDQVTNMSSMFHGAKSFNQPLNDWRVDNVTTMQSMFDGASAFNQPLNDWRVDNVTSMGSMFYSASAFDQPLGDWQLRPDCNTCNMFGHPDYNICTNFQNSRPKQTRKKKKNSRPVKKTSRETCCAIS